MSSKKMVVLLPLENGDGCNNQGQEEEVKVAQDTQGRILQSKTGKRANQQKNRRRRRIQRRDNIETDRQP